MTYRMIRQLGAGYFGAVWLADDVTNRRCAVKLLDPKLLGRSIDEIHAEAKALVESEHDHVVHVYGAGVLSDGTPYICMEYLDRGSVADLYGNGPAPVRDALAYVIDACRGVECAHEHGLLHRDIKPANLLLGANGRVKVSDFGLACRQDDPHNGALAYVPHLPPEDHGSGHITTVAGDVFALGMTLYRLLNGDALLDACLKPGEDVLQAIAAGRYPNRRSWLPHIPKNVRRVVNRALDIDEQRRTPSAWAFRKALEKVLPVVSWEPTKTDQTRWHGSTVDGRRAWLVEITAQRSGYELHVKSGPTGGRLRQRDKPTTYSDMKDAMAAATRVLDRIALRGE